MRLSEKDRFMKYVSENEDGCWEWTGFKMSSGYGRFSQAGRNSSQPTELAHRASYRIFNGDPSGTGVMHSCDNPCCVNPEHLSLGTQTDNMRDAKNKGRNASGEAHGRSKLTLIEVNRIRETEGLFQREIAEIFNVSQATVSDIKNGRKWANLVGEYHR